MNKGWVVYLLKCSDSTLYCGITNNLELRLKKHNEGKGAKYTKNRLPVALYRFFSVSDKSTALKVELKVKKLSRDKKLQLNSIDIFLNKKEKLK